MLVIESDPFMLGTNEKCLFLFPVQLYAATAAPGLSFFKQSYVFVRYHRDISNTATPGTLSEHRRRNELETE